MSINIRTFEYESDEYIESLRIRDEVFRKPWGLSIYDDDNTIDKTNIMYGAFIGDRLVGFTFLQPLEADLGRIRCVITTDDVRGTGLGRRLMETAEQKAMELGIKNLELMSRVSAEPFYKKLGYIPVSDIYEYRRVPHIDMGKKLTPEFTFEAQVTIANPSGNITAIVSGVTDRTLYSEIGSELMKLPEYEIEQVGFVENVDSKSGAIARLQMAGGEFCANASRSFGLYLAMEKNLPDGDIPIEVSGSNAIVHTTVDKSNKLAAVAIDTKRVIKQLVISGSSYPCVIMDGISHVIVTDCSPDDALNSELIDAVIIDHNPAAIGIMYLDIENTFITPFVYVPSFGTSVYENSCGSGTIATALYMTDLMGLSDCNFRLNQPGGPIDVSASESEGIFHIVISGPVSFKKIHMSL